MRQDPKDPSVVAVQSSSHVRLFETSWIATHQASLSFTVSWSLLRFMSTESVMLSISVSGSSSSVSTTSLLSGFCSFSLAVLYTETTVMLPFRGSLSRLG